MGASAAAWNAAPLAGGRVGSTSTADPMERPASMRTAMVGSAYVHTRTCLRHRFRQVRRACLGCARRSSQTGSLTRLPQPPDPFRGPHLLGRTRSRSRTRGHDGSCGGSRDLSRRAPHSRKPDPLIGKRLCGDTHTVSAVATNASDSRGHGSRAALNLPSREGLHAPMPAFPHPR